MNVQTMNQQQLEAVVLGEDSPMRALCVQESSAAYRACDAAGFERANLLAMRLAAASELMRRVAYERLMHANVFEFNEQAENYVKAAFLGTTTESFIVMYLNAQHALIAAETAFKGSIERCHVHPGEIARRALQLSSVAVIIAHCHPSGHCTPSRSDEVLTQSIAAALSLIEVRLLDHLIASCDGQHCSSFTKLGLL